MENLTFGEQVKITLGRKGMTIKELAEQIEARTGKNMSRQNMTQRLKRDNFQEQDMRMIAEILGYKLEVRMVEASPEELASLAAAKTTSKADFEEVTEVLEMEEPEEILEEEQRIVSEREMTVGEIVDLTEAIAREPEPEIKAERKQERKPEPKAESESEVLLGEINPYTGKEYQTNSVRKHPSRIAYVQVYDRAMHGWKDMTEWAFLGEQERRKALYGKDYQPPIFLD